MEFDVTTLGVVIGMMVLANRLRAMLIYSAREKYGWDKFGLAYPARILAGVFVWFYGVNLFATFIPNQLIGQILTAISCRGWKQFAPRSNRQAGQSDCRVQCA